MAMAFSTRALTEWILIAMELLGLEKSGQQLLFSEISRVTYMPVDVADVFDTARDWIYLDNNNNNRRDFGSAAGFDDDALAFGEPLFVPDDVNGDGALEVGERLVRLGSSKVRAFYHKGTVYTRGANLTQLPINGTEWDNWLGWEFYGWWGAAHGTGVNDIVLGGTLLAHRQDVGIAPHAELIVGNGQDIQAMMWGLDQKPDVALMEFGVGFGEPIDGSDAWAQLVDTSVQSGTFFACAAGNDGVPESGQQGSHAVAPIKSAVAELPFVLHGTVFVLRPCVSRARRQRFERYHYAA